MLGLPASFLDWHWLSRFPMFIVFFISALPKPTVLPSTFRKRKSELVAGHMVEYGSTPYMMFMLGEYAAIVLICCLTTILFLGGWLPIVDCMVPELGAWYHLVRAEGLHGFFFISRSPRPFVSALPLRPAHAPWLEGFPAAVARHGRYRCIRTEADGVGRLMSKLSLKDLETEMASLSQAVNSLFLKEIRRRDLPDDASLLQAEGDDQLSFRKGSGLAALPWRTCAAPLSNGEERCIACKLCESDLSCSGDHHRSRPASQRRHAPHGALPISTW